MEQWSEETTEYLETKLLITSFLVVKWLGILLIVGGCSSLAKVSLWDRYMGDKHTEYIGFFGDRGSITTYYNKDGKYLVETIRKDLSTHYSVPYKKKGWSSEVSGRVIYRKITQGKETQNLATRLSVPFEEGVGQGVAVAVFASGGLAGVFPIEKNKIHGIARRYYDTTLLGATLQHKRNIGWEEVHTRQVEVEVPYEKGKIHGVVSKYYPSGRTRSQERYAHGRRHGYSIIFYESGLKALEVGWFCGLPHGEAFRFFASGSVHQTGVYIKGKKQGRFNTYDEKGRILHSSVYHQDSLLEGFLPCEEKRAILACPSPNAHTGTAKQGIQKGVSSVLSFPFRESLPEGCPDKYTNNGYSFSWFSIDNTSENLNAENRVSSILSWYGREPRPDDSSTNSLSDDIK
jgi:hypothetical protein